LIRKRRQQLVQIYIISDVLALAGAFLLTFWLRFHSGLLQVPKGIPRLQDYLIVLPFLMSIHILYFSHQEFYRLKLRRNRLDDLFQIIINAIIASFFILLLFSYLKSYRFVSFELSHLFLITYAPLAAFFVFEFRILVLRTFRSLMLGKNGISRILIAGEGDFARLTARNLLKYSHFGIDVCGFLSDQPGDDVIGTDRDLADVVRKYGITDLFIALPLREYDRIMALIETGNNLYIDIRLVPDLLQLASIKAGMEHIEGIPVINLGDIPMRGWGVLIKRLLDIVISLAGLIIGAPFLLLIVLWIILDSGFPVFYRQTRIGLDGRVFKIIKFRTMVSDAEKQTGPVWSPKGDTRITRAGRILRKLSLDEIPQLFNILAGDMSLVGPRPERPELVEKFKNHIPRYMLRHRVKAGLTGWAQVHGLRGNTPLDQRIEFDIYYIQNWTFKLDLEILFRTIVKFKFIDHSD